MQGAAEKTHVFYLSIKSLSSTMVYDAALVNFLPPSSNSSACFNLNENVLRHLSLLWYHVHQRKMTRILTENSLRCRKSLSLSSHA